MDKHLFEYYNQLGRDNIKATSSDFTKAVGEEGIKDIIRKVFMGGNVRDVTEFITQRRLLNSYFAMLDLYMNYLGDYVSDTNAFAEMVTNDLKRAKTDEKILDLWLLGLTKKGLDNIVRTEANIVDYQHSFSASLTDAAEDFENTYGKITGTIEINNKKLNVDWKLLSLLFIAMGSQTLSIRGSAKSMNGKMFEKLVLGSLLTISGFKYLSGPPLRMKKDEKYFWLSNMDANERETDATLAYNGKAVSIDIGFIGKGNPEITLDKVTRFNAYKQIGGVDHDMATIIIVDTVAPNSDLVNKASRVNGRVLQMKESDWTIRFSNAINEIFGIETELSKKNQSELEDYFKEKLDNIDITEFI